MCIFCDKSFSTKKDQIQHDIANHIKDEKYICSKEECLFSDGNKISVMNHFADEHKNISLKYCQHCDQCFFMRSNLRKHMNIAHNLRVPDNVCLMCPEILSSERKAYDHMKSGQHKNNLFVCMKGAGVCKQTFDSYVDLKSHIANSHTISEILTCHVCGENYKKANHAHFRRHVKAHELTEKNFICQYCNDSFYFEIDLKRHTHRKHEKKVLCTMCDYRSWNESRMQKHNQLVHANIPRSYKCNQCDYASKTKENLVRHSTTHSDVRSFECNFCGKAFKLLKHLSKHKRIHTNDYEAHCKICNKPFIQKCNLKQHMKKMHPEANME